MPSAASTTLGEGRRRYFADNGFPADGGYDARWVVIRFRGLPVFAFPNTADRRRAVPFHDLHHVLTGYATDLRGEAEIGAWELASGCTSSRAATLLNLQVLGFVLPRHPRRMFRAFLRGRRSRNLYGGHYDDALLARSLHDLREQLGIAPPPERAEPSDRRAFARWAGLALLQAWWPALALLLWLLLR